MTNRKERRRSAAMREIEEAALRPDVTKESVGEMDYENAVAQSNELTEFNSYAAMGPDLEDSDGFDRHEIPETIDTEESN